MSHLLREDLWSVGGKREVFWLVVWLDEGGRKKEEGGAEGGYLYRQRNENDGGKQGGWGYARPHGRRSE